MRPFWAIVALLWGLSPVMAQEDPRQQAERVIATARTVGDRLDERDPGTETQQLQGDILGTIDEWIDQQKNLPPPPMGGGGGGGGDNQPMPMGGGGEPQPMPMGGGGQGQLPSERPNGGGGEPAPGGVDPRPLVGGSGIAGAMPPVPQEQERRGGGAADRMADLDRGLWGNLPPMLQEELDHYYRERFSPRYADLLRQYYSLISEASRK